MQGYHGQNHHQRNTKPVQLQAEYPAVIVGRERPLELVRFAQQRTVPVRPSIMVGAYTPISTGVMLLPIMFQHNLKSATNSDAD